jgi:hypothetical protein
MNLHEFICTNDEKMIKKANNLFKLQFSLNLSLVICSISGVEALFERVN